MQERYDEMMRFNYQAENTQNWKHTLRLEEMKRLNEEK